MENLVLKFSNPIFNPAPKINVTVRRGVKWAGVNNSDHFVKLEDGTPVAILCTSTYASVMNIPAKTLSAEHDPSCRTRKGLIAEMKRVYNDFKVDESVTVIEFLLC